MFYKYIRKHDDWHLCVFVCVSVCMCKCVWLCIVYIYNNDLLENLFHINIYIFHHFFMKKIFICSYKNITIYIKYIYRKESLSALNKLLELLFNNTLMIVRPMSDSDET